MVKSNIIKIITANETVIYAVNDFNFNIIGSYNYNNNIPDESEYISRMLDIKGFIKGLYKRGWWIEQVNYSDEYIINIPEELREDMYNPYLTNIFENKNLLCCTQDSLAYYWLNEIWNKE